MEHVGVRSPIPVARLAAIPPRVVVFLVHLAPVAWLFGAALFPGRVLYFRDLSTWYAPDYAFLHRALAQGVWPLWNPQADGGSPTLFCYPGDLVLAGLFGPLAPLGLGAALHLYLALCGGTVLARRLGQGWLAAWTTGTVYGLSGFFLSSVNLVQVSQSAAWAPFVLAAFLRLGEAPTSRNAARLALLAAVQVSTLGLEVAIQTLMAGLFLAPALASRLRDSIPHWLSAVVLTLLLAAPALFGGAWLLRGSARGAGFTAAAALGYSASPVVLLEALLPRFFGNVHAFSDFGFWGQSHFPQGYPYLLSLYLGPIAIGLASAARRGRLHIVFLVGLVLSLGEYGPFGSVLPTLLPFLRAPVKFFFLCTLAVALLAGEGIERAKAFRSARRRALGVLAIAGLGLMGMAVLLRMDANLAARVFGGVVPALADPRALVVARSSWPIDWFATGAGCLAAALVLAAPPRWFALSSVVLAVDLLTVNGVLNPLTESTFYRLGTAMQDMVRRAEGEGRYRWFSYGAGNSPGLRWNPQTALAGSDAWLYYVDRQALLPRTQVLDGLDGVFDTDRTGWAPPGSTLPVAEISPAFFAAHVERLRLANVRWVLSFAPLPEDAVTLRSRVPFAETLDPLLVYELRDPLPRAFWVASTPSDPALLRPDSRGRVAYSRPDPHTIVLDVESPAGDLVLLEYRHPDWRLEPGGEGGPILTAFNRYCRIPTGGGGRRLVLRFVPGWRPVALGCTAFGLLGIAVLWVGRRAPRQQA